VRSGRRRRPRGIRFQAGAVADLRSVPPGDSYRGCPASAHSLAYVVARQVIAGVMDHGGGRALPAGAAVTPRVQNAPEGRLRGSVGMPSSSPERFWPIELDGRRVLAADHGRAGCVPEPAVLGQRRIPSPSPRPMPLPCHRRGNGWSPGSARVQTRPSRPSTSLRNQ
jgi:hypothetical protein